jgi:Spy/CpxP family protein refolding chaperone
MQKKLTTLVGLGAVTLLGALGAIAQDSGPRHRGHGPEGFRGAGRVLDLTEDQQAAAREIFERQRPEREALRAETRENRAALRESLESEQPDPLLVGELMIEGKALRGRSQALRDVSKQALASILDDEQKQKLELLEAMRGEKGPHGRHGRRGSGRGPRGPSPEAE